MPPYVGDARCRLCPQSLPLLLSQCWFSTGLHASALLEGFILVHLNIHDSLHFCSKRHLFI
uniref:Uncharacterized protein n=1 Tax=Falco tinnunculus TaxID=100819 RepID=A0A8C4UQL5_FALTI